MPTRRRFIQSSAAACGVAFASSLQTSGQPPERESASGSKERKFKLGTVTYNIAKDWDLPTLLDVCKKTGLAAVECRTTHKHGVEPSLSREKRADVKKRFADSGIVFWGCGSTCEFHAPEAEKVDEHIDTCKHFIQLTAELGGRGVKVRPNGLPKGVPVEKTLEQIGKALIECGKAAADAGIEIWVEVHGAGTSEPRHMKTIMQHCGLANVGVTWNSNGTDLVKGSVAEGFALLKPWIKSCHINDLYNDQKGVYPYRELFRLLREMGYDRYTLCEVGRTMPDLASGTEFLKYYHALWNELSKTTGT